MSTFRHSIIIFHVTPLEIAGTVGAIYNAGLYLSTAVGVLIITAIQLGVNSNIGSADTFKGRVAGFRYVLALDAARVLEFVQGRGGGEGGDWKVLARTTRSRWLLMRLYEGRGLILVTGRIWRSGRAHDSTNAWTWDERCNEITQNGIEGGMYR